MSTTGPVIWITRPVAVGAAVGMGWLLRSASAGLGAGRDLDHFAGDVRLANLVVGKRVVLDEGLGIVGRIAHRDHPARLLAGLALQHGLEEPSRDVARQELLQDGARIRLEDELLAGDARCVGRWLARAG